MNFETDENFYHEKLKNNPKDLESIFKLSALYLQTQRFNLAKLILDKGIEIYPNHAGLRNNLGAALEKQGELKKQLDAKSNKK